MQVGNQEILLPTMMIGSYPKPRWFNGNGFTQLPVGTLTPDSLVTEALEDCINVIVQDQINAGIDVISDGLVVSADGSYSSKLYYVTERLNGVLQQGPPIPIPVYSTLYSPTVVGKITRKAPMMVHQVKTLRKLTDKPIKVNFPGIQVFALGLTNQHYDGGPPELGMDIAKAYNEEFKELVTAGVDVIQLDEFLWHYGLSDSEWETEIFNAAVEGVEAKVVIHVCWGNYGGTPGYLPESPEAAAAQMQGTEFVLGRRSKGATTNRAEAIFPRSNTVNISAINFEMGHYGMQDLQVMQKNDWQKDFIAGIIDVKNLETETADEVAERIRMCLEIIPAERLGLTTDCGMINLPRIVCQSKLRALVEGTEIVRRELAG